MHCYWKKLGGLLQREGELGGLLQRGGRLPVERSYSCAVQRRNRWVAIGESFKLLQEETRWIASAGRSCKREGTGWTATKGRCKFWQKGNRTDCYKKKLHVAVPEKKQGGLLQEGASCCGKKACVATRRSWKLLHEETEWVAT